MLLSETLTLVSNHLLYCIFSIFKTYWVFLFFSFLFLFLFIYLFFVLLWCLSWATSMYSFFLLTFPNISYLYQTFDKTDWEQLTSFTTLYNELDDFLWGGPRNGAHSFLMTPKTSMELNSVEMRMAKGAFSIRSLFGEFLLLGK